MKKYNDIMEHHNFTDNSTSVTLIVITILLKILSVITANHVIIALTIVSLLFTIVYHAFGIYERYNHYKNNKKEKK